MIKIIPAKLTDIPYIWNIVNEFASEGKMLPITEDEIAQKITSFFIAVDEGKIVGTVSAVFFYPNLVEVRSLAVKEQNQNKGIGKLLVESVENVGREKGAKIVFALTRSPEFFEKLGYQIIDKHNLPQKIFRDCVNCPLFPDCDEVAVVKEL